MITLNSPVREISTGRTGLVIGLSPVSMTIRFDDDASAVALDDADVYKQFASIVLPRSANPLEYRYTVEEQAPAGNWVASARMHDEAGAVRFAKSLGARGATARVIDEYE